MNLPKQILRYISGILYPYDEVSATKLSKFFSSNAHDSFTRTLNRSFRWDKLLLSLAFRLFTPRGGYLIIDEHVISKQYSTSMEGTSWVFSPILKRIVRGYSIVVIAWSNGNVCIPFAFRIWQKGESKKTELAYELIQYSHKLGLKPEAVLFDSFYASKKILKLIDSFGWIFVTQVSRNRKFREKRVDKRSFLPYWTATGVLSGCIEVVMVKHGRKYFCSNDLDLGHQKVRNLYKKRWPIEEIFRLSKGKLGLQKCESRSLNAQKAHITIVFISYILLQKESVIKNQSDYKIKEELSYSRDNYPLTSMKLLIQ